MNDEHRTRAAIWNAHVKRVAAVEMLYLIHLSTVPDLNLVPPVGVRSTAPLPIDLPVD
jgi:hypothetical protein